MITSLLPQEKLEALRQLFAAIILIHKLGIKHNDINSKNILIQRKENKILNFHLADFGLAVGELNSAGDRVLLGQLFKEMICQDTEKDAYFANKKHLNKTALQDPVNVIYEIKSYDLSAKFDLDAEMQKEKDLYNKL